MNDSNRIKIALVDDHTLVRDGIRALLAMVPHFEIIGEASDGQETITLLQQHMPDILLMDIGLKDINGLELTATLKKIYPALKVLILSMYDNQEYVSSALHAGACGYVLKDAPSREIIAAIDVLAIGGQFYSSGIADKLTRDDTTERELTPRERQVLLMMAQGLNNKAMARELQLSVRTVETYRLNIRRKLDIDKPADLVKHAREHGWAPV